MCSTLNANPCWVIPGGCLLSPIFDTNCWPPFTPHPGRHSATVSCSFWLYTSLYYLLKMFSALGTGACSFLSPPPWPSLWGSIVPTPSCVPCACDPLANAYWDWTKVLWSHICFFSLENGLFQMGASFFLMFLPVKEHLGPKWALRCSEWEIRICCFELLGHY